jgi:hypothetical protein
MSCRQTQNLWWWLYRYGLRKTLKQKPWRGGYFWEDSFWTHFYRILGCRHKPSWIEDERKWYCFCCHTNLPEIKEIGGSTRKGKE